jgi:hypothetical protein
MKNSVWIIVIAAFSFIFAACAKKASGPGAIKFQLKATNTLAGLQRTNAASIQWTSGTATPSAVKFEAKQGLSEVEFTSTAGQTVDLFNIAQSSFGNITLADGTYNEIEFKISLNGTTASPALELNGTFDNGTVITPVSFRVTAPLLIKTEKNNVAISSGSFTAVTELNLAVYATGISQAMMNSATWTGGTIVISSASNANLYNIIVSNIDRFHHADIHHD